MTAPAASSPRPGPAWSPAEPTPFGPAWQRLVPDRGVLTVAYAGRAAGGYRWGLSPIYFEYPLGGKRDGYADPAAAMREADRRVAGLRPGIFDGLALAEARHLFLALRRRGPLSAGTVPDHDDLAALAFRRIEVLALAPGYQGPDPAAIRDQANTWRYAASRTGLRDSDFSPDALGIPAGSPARPRLAAAEARLLARPDDADRELKLAGDTAGRSPAGRAARDAIRALRGRMNAATAADRNGTPIRQFDRVLYPVRNRQEAGVVERVAGANGLDGGRAALVFADRHHLATGYDRSVPYADLTVLSRGADPVTANTARPYAAWLPAGVTPEAAGRGALAAAIRHGRFAAEGATREAIAYHRAHHRDGAVSEPMARCPHPRCRGACSDWAAWATLYAGPAPAWPAVLPPPARPRGRAARPAAPTAVRPARRGAR